MPVIYEKVGLEHIGRGGQAGDVPLVEQVEEALERLSMLVVDERATGAGTCTVKLTVAKTGDESVLVTYSVTVKDPRRQTKGLTAIVNPETGELHAAHHKQEALPLPQAVPLRATANGDEGTDDDEGAPR